MLVIAFSRNRKTLSEISAAARIAFPNSELCEYSDERECIDFAADSPCDVALVDDGAKGTVAQRLSEIRRETNLIVVSDSDAAKMRAMDLHASGFILRPVTSDRIREEMRFARFPVTKDPDLLIRAQCFGNFDVFSVDGVPLRFSRSKSKELLAYLIYRRGASCSVKEVGAALFEDEEYDTKQQIYLRQIISTLIRTMRVLGMEEVVQHSYNSLSVNVNVIDCDYYRFLEKDPSVMQQYTGEFMSQYPWAEDVAGYLDRISDEA